VAPPALGALHASCPLCATRLHLVYLLAELAAPLSAGDAFSSQIIGEVVLWLLPPRELRMYVMPVCVMRLSLGAVC
jgi:hypothetical protein